MLKSLNIENIAIIEKASLDFSKGLNILTGETGAGKSIIIDSINAVTGQKTSRELIRTGENSAVVSAMFENISPAVKNQLEENALPEEDDGTLLLQRKLYKDGKNVCRINGAPVTVSILKSIGVNLINIHGQRDSQALLDPEKHIDFLDSFAKDKKYLEEYEKCYTALKNSAREIKSLQMDEDYKIRRTDILKFQTEELTAADIKPGEREELHKKKNILVNSVKLLTALKNAYNCLNGDGENPGASGLINSAYSEIVSVSSLAKGLGALTDSLSNISSLIEDSSGLIEDVISQLDSIDGNLNEIEERLDLLYRLSKKYGETEEEMCEFLENANNELDAIETSSERLSELQVEYDRLYKKTLEAADILSDKRKKAVNVLSSEIQSELSFLDMPSCKFEVSIKETPLDIKGKDSVEFLISANAGEEAKSLNKVASGGELSRIMLAMKNILNSSEGADTLIFDEIDTGVSGSAAKRIAIKLAEVSENTQVLCITHLSQIASFADEHKYIYKEVCEDKTFTRVKSLSLEQRAEELARMTYGGEIQEIQIESSRRMIEDAEKIRISKEHSV